MNEPAPAKPPTMIVMNKEKDCKGSVKYSTDDPDAVVTNVYLSRKFAEKMPERITITVR